MDEFRSFADRSVPHYSLLCALHRCSIAIVVVQFFIVIHKTPQVAHGTWQKFNSVDDLRDPSITPPVLSPIRWENVITHVPCGDGVLVIQAEWAAQFRVNPPVPREGCEQISGFGHLTNSRGVQSWKRSDNVWDSFVTHEMGHAVGVG